MKKFSIPQERRGQAGGTRAIVLPLVFFLLGIALSAYWFYRNKPVEAARPEGVPLSEKTRTLLQHLPMPVELRFYSMLPASTASPSLRAYSERVGAMLAAFQQASEGRLNVTSVSEPSDAHADAATADGVPAFNREKGEACFLGLVVACQNSKESFPQLQPDWEPALEFDLARAIERVTIGQAPSTPRPVMDTNFTEEVASTIKLLIPEIKTTSLEDGKRILEEASMKELAAASAAMDAEIKAAQQAVNEAQQQGKPEAEQQAALKRLQQVALEQADKIKRVAAQRDARLNMFQQLKSAGSQ